MRYLLFFLLCSFSGYSQTIFMKVTGPVINGDATTISPENYTNQIVLKDFSMGVSRFINMEDLASTQRSYANSELSLVTINFYNKAFVINGLREALYEGTTFQEVKIVMVAPTAQGDQEVFEYVFKNVIFSSLTSFTQTSSTPTSTATFKAGAIEVKHSTYDGSGMPEEEEMIWNFITNTGTVN